MNDTLRVGGVEAFGNLPCPIEKDLGLQRPPRNAMRQRHPVEKLHRNEGLAVVLRDFVDGANVGMVQGRGGAGLSAKTFQRLRVVCHVLGQELQRDKAAEFGVLSLVHHTHPAAAKFLNDVVVRDGLADHFEENSSPRRTQS